MLQFLLQCLNVLVDDIFFRLLSSQTPAKGFWMGGLTSSCELHDLDSKQPFPRTSSSQNNSFPVPTSDCDSTMITWEGKLQELHLSACFLQLSAAAAPFLSSCSPGVCTRKLSEGEHSASKTLNPKIPKAETCKPKTCPLRSSQTTAREGEFSGFRQIMGAAAEWKNEGICRRIGPAVCSPMFTQDNE